MLPRSKVVSPRDRQEADRGPDIEPRDLKLGKFLGSGSSGQVFQASWHNKNVAVKKLHQTLPQEQFNNLVTEAQHLTKSRFPHVVSLYGTTIIDDRCALVLEFMQNGSLYDVLQNRDIPLSWSQRWNLASDIASGLSFLHSRNIIHQDLKSQNILLDENFRGKISDFGLSAISSLSSPIETKTNNPFGTLRWRSPESFLATFQADPSMDIYSAGMILWELSSRELPFAGESSELNLTRWISTGEKEDIPADCPKELAYIITRCWEAPLTRPTAKELMDMIQPHALVNPVKVSIETPSELPKEKSLDEILDELLVDEPDAADIKYCISLFEIVFTAATHSDPLPLFQKAMKAAANIPFLKGLTSSDYFASGLYFFVLGSLACFSELEDSDLASINIRCAKSILNLDPNEIPIGKNGLPPRPTSVTRDRHRSHGPSKPEDPSRSSRGSKSRSSSSSIAESGPKSHPSNSSIAESPRSTAIAASPTEKPPQKQCNSLLQLMEQELNKCWSSTSKVINKAGFTEAHSKLMLQISEIKKSKNSSQQQLCQLSKLASNVLQAAKK